MYLGRSFCRLTKFPNLPLKLQFVFSLKSQSRIFTSWPHWCRNPEFIPHWSQWKSHSRISPPLISVEVAIPNLSPIDISVNRNPESLPADLSGSHSGAPRVSSLSCSCICGRGGCTWHRGGKLTVRFSKRQNNILFVCSLILIAFKVPKKTAVLMHYITF